MKHDTFIVPSPEELDVLRRFPIWRMKARSRWVGFKIRPQKKGKPRKVPCIADRPTSKASSTAPATWSSFDVALAGLADGKFSAVGYSLGDGIVGIDLDGERWVSGERTATPEAMDLVQRCGSYVEFSISKRGIHLLLCGRLPGTGKADHEAGVEMYDNKRLLIVTGDQIPGTPSRIVENQEAIDWILSELIEGERKGMTSESLNTSDSSEHSDHSDYSAHSAHSAHLDSELVDELIMATQPRTVGERNARIFDFARGLRFNAELAGVQRVKLKPIVRKWWAMARDVIGTQDFTETWGDFIRAWDTVRCPLGANPLTDAVQKAKAGDLPGIVSEYDSETARLLAGVCWHLAQHDPQRRFFLGTHRGAELLGVAPSLVHKFLRMFEADELILAEKRGDAHRATRYRWIAPAKEKS